MNSSDQHVIPATGREHMAATNCWCSPHVDDGVPHPSGARVWIHNEHTRHAELSVRCATGVASRDEMFEYALLELQECASCLEPSAPGNGRAVDGHHASACALRAFVTLKQLKETA